MLFKVTKATTYHLDMKKAVTFKHTWLIFVLHNTEYEIANCLPRQAAKLCDYTAKAQCFSNKKIYLHENVCQHQSIRSIPLHTVVRHCFHQKARMQWHGLKLEHSRQLHLMVVGTRREVSGNVPEKFRRQCNQCLAYEKCVQLLLHRVHALSEAKSISICRYTKVHYQYHCTHAEQYFTELESPESNCAIRFQYSMHAQGCSSK